MSSKRWMALAGVLASIFLVSSILLFYMFYKDVDQGITLSHCDSMLTEKRQSTDLLQVLVRSKLVGNLDKQKFIGLLKAEAVPYYSLEGDDVLFASYVVFEFENGVLKNVREATEN